MAGGLDLSDITKGIFWDKEEGPGVKVDVEEIERFFEAAERLPLPELSAFFCFKQDAAVFQGEGEGVLESGRLFIDAEGQDTAYGDPEEEPEDGEDEEGQGLDLFKEEEDGGEDGENVDHYNEGSDLGSAEEVAA